MNIKLFNHAINEPSLFYMIGANAWDECEELQVTPKDQWLSNSVNSIMQYNRVEVLAHTDGRAAGGCILMEDRGDPHVGDCTCIGYQYVFPEFRNKGVSRLLMREALRYTRDKGYSILKYSHRLKPWRYEIIYIKV